MNINNAKKKFKINKLKTFRILRLVRRRIRRMNRFCVCKNNTYILDAKKNFDKYIIDRVKMAVNKLPNRYKNAYFIVTKEFRYDNYTFKYKTQNKKIAINVNKPHNTYMHNPILTGNEYRGRITVNTCKISKLDHFDINCEELIIYKEGLGKTKYIFADNRFYVRNRIYDHEELKYLSKYIFCALGLDYIKNLKNSTIYYIPDNFDALPEAYEYEEEDEW